MKLAVFAITVASELLLAGSLVLSIISPKHRVWPPPGRNSWQFWFTWILTDIAAIGCATVAVLDWNTFVISHWSRFAVGLPLVVFGMLFPLWGIRTLSMHASLGLEAKLITEGPYRYSRNPQYVGSIALLLGLGLISNSLLTMIACGLGSLWFLVAPFTEEPWLSEQYGKEYDEYRSRTRRFL